MSGAQLVENTLCRRMLRQTLLWTEAKPWQEAPDFRTVTPRQVASHLQQLLLMCSKEVILPSRLTLGNDAGCEIHTEGEHPGSKR